MTMIFNPNQIPMFKILMRIKIAKDMKYRIHKLRKPENIEIVENKLIISASTQITKSSN